MQLADFCGKYRLRRKVVTYMKKDWAPLAEHWACWGAGRLDPGVAAMLSDTNNYSESLFRQLKYTDLNRNAQSSIQQLVDTLLNTTVPRCMQQRAHQVVGRASSDQVARAERVKKVVDYSSVDLCGAVERRAKYTRNNVYKPRFRVGLPSGTCIRAARVPGHADQGTRDSCQNR